MIPKNLLISGIVVNWFLFSGAKIHIIYYISRNPRNKSSKKDKKLCVFPSCKGPSANKSSCLCVQLNAWFEPALDVALEAVVLGTLDGGTLEEASVLFFREVLPVVGHHLQEGFGGLEGWLFGRFGFGELRRGPQAAVAAVEGASKADILGQRASVLNGHIADTASGIKAIRSKGGA